jgi:hypothetical protein
LQGFGLGMFNYEGSDSPFYARFPGFRGRMVGLVAKIMFYIPLVSVLL